MTYEGQGAILLEAMADENETGSYSIPLREEGPLLLLDTAAFVPVILADLKSGSHPRQAAARFMNAMVCLALRQCQWVREKTGLHRVVLSGGVFLNHWLLSRICASLEEAGFIPYHHSRVSTNDQGIALGQTLIAAKGGGTPCV